MTWTRMAAIVIPALSLVLFGASGDSHADLVLNGGFEQTFSGTVAGGKDSVYNNAPNPMGALNNWVVGMNASTGRSLTAIDTPGTATLMTNGTIGVYGPFPNASPNGGNFIQMDGDPTYSATISQTLTGLTPGKTYEVSFYQAAGQQQGFKDPTYEYWQVGFGSQTQNSTQINLPGTDGTPAGDAADHAPWALQTLIFTADGTSDVLSFLAVGPTNNLPPIVFLDGVSVDPYIPPVVPEPSSVLLTVVGLLGLGVVYLRQQRVRPAAV